MASNSWRSCTELVTVKFSIAFTLCQFCVKASSNFATVKFFAIFEMCGHLVNVNCSSCQQEVLLKRIICAHTDTSNLYAVILA